MLHLQDSLISAQDYMEPDYYLPEKYEETFIVLMIRDPQNVFAYWEVAKKTTDEMIGKYGEENIKTSKIAIRLTWPNNSTETIITNNHARSWYISVADKGLPSFGELGLILADNTFITLARSNYLGNYFSPYHLENSLQGITLNKWHSGISSLNFQTKQGKD
ncbi:MAG: DUF4912 domain-containing protein [Bacillota bacterium]